MSSSAIVLSFAISICGNQIPQSDRQVFLDVLRSVVRGAHAMTPQERDNVLYEVASLYALIGDIDGADTVVTMHSTESGKRRAKRGLARVYASQGRVDHVRRLIKQMQDIDPNTSTTLYSILLTYTSELGALNVIEILQSSGNQFSQLNKGMVYLKLVKLSDLAQREKYLDQSLKILGPSMDDVQVRYSLVEVYLYIGAFDKARRIINTNKPSRLFWAGSIRNAAVRLAREGKKGEALRVAALIRKNHIYHSAISDVLDELSKQRKLDPSDRQLFQIELRDSYTQDKLIYRLAEQRILEGRWASAVELAKNIKGNYSAVIIMTRILQKATPEQRRGVAYAELLETAVKKSARCGRDWHVGMLVAAALLHAQAGDLKKARELAVQFPNLIEGLEHPLDFHDGWRGFVPVVDLVRLSKKISDPSLARRVIVNYEKLLDAGKDDLMGIDKLRHLTNLGLAWTLLGSNGDVKRLYQSQNDQSGIGKRAVLLGYVRGVLNRRTLSQISEDISEFENTSFFVVHDKLLLLKEYLMSKKIDISSIVN